MKELLNIAKWCFVLLFLAEFGEFHLTSVKSIYRATSPYTSVLGNLGREEIQVSLLARLFAHWCQTT